MKAGSDSKTVADFKAQVEAWAGRVRVKPRQIRVQQMRRKWASCSTGGTVSFNEELLQQPAAFRDYVIVHELLHLRVPNHGKLFKSLLRAYLPNYESSASPTGNKLRETQILYGTLTR